MQINRMAAANMFFQKPFHKQWTHQLWSTGEQRQIDYLLVDSCLRGRLRDAGANDDIDIKSDHRCTFASFAMDHCPRSRDKRTPGRKRLNASTFKQPDVLASYHNLLDEVLSDPSLSAETLAEKVVVAAAAAGERADLLPEERASRHSQEMRDLFTARRNALDPEERKICTRQIWACMRKERRDKQSNKLDMLLESGRGRHDLAKMLNAPVRRKKTVAILDSSGTKCTTTEGILEVFAAFYENLYDALKIEPSMAAWAGQSASISAEDVSNALKKLKSGKASGDDQLMAEMLKTDHQGLIDFIAAAFTDILHGSVEVPVVWCKSRLVILFKKGDATVPINY